MARPNLHIALDQRLVRQHDWERDIGECAAAGGGSRGGGPRVRLDLVNQRLVPNIREHKLRVVTPDVGGRLGSRIFLTSPAVEAVRGA